MISVKIPFANGLAFQVLPVPLDSTNVHGSRASECENDTDYSCNHHTKEKASKLGYSRYFPTLWCANPAWFMHVMHRDFY